MNFFCLQEQIQCDNNIIYRRAQKLESDANNSGSNKIISTDKNCNATSSTPLDRSRRTDENARRANQANGVLQARFYRGLCSVVDCIQYSSIFVVVVVAVVAAAGDSALRSGF